MNAPKVTKILSVTQEAPTIKTIGFTRRGPVRSGQFYMIWIPGVDEIPMSVSGIHDGTATITFKNIGPATNALFQLKTGDKIGVRGPYGNGFILEGKNLLVVGGGTGIAMMAPVVEQAREQGKNVTVIIGAKAKDDLFFEKRMKNTGAEVFLTTDDGSTGFQGFATDLVIELIENHSFDSIYTCGPELMMKQLMDITSSPMQASMERYMKCAIGLCGQCCVGEGLRVCVDGPIFNRETLEQLPEFGVYTRDASGRKKPIK